MRRWQVPYLARGTVATPEELEEVARCLREAPTLSCGEARAAFERRFATHVGAAHALTVPNCTVALELATQVADLRPGDEVIATPQTYQATISPLLARDVTVRFCDVDPDSLNADPTSVEGLFTERTRAVYVLHYGGLPVDMAPIVAAARRYGAIVIEDCAHALGAADRGCHPGTLGDIGCFSFGSGKNMTTLGAGGALTCSRVDLAARLDRLRSVEPDARFVPRPEPVVAGHGPPPPTAYWHEKNAFLEDCVDLWHGGTNGTLSEIACVAGLVQLGSLEANVARRREHARRLDRGLSAIEGVRAQEVGDGVRHAHHLYTFFVEPGLVDRDAVIARLDAAGIEIVMRYFPLHLLPEWRRRGHDGGECPTAERVWFREQVNLPCYPSLTHDQVDYMVEQVTLAVAGARRRAPR